MFGFGRRRKEYEEQYNELKYRYIELVKDTQKNNANDKIEYNYDLDGFIRKGKEEGIDSWQTFEKGKIVTYTYTGYEYCALYSSAQYDFNWERIYARSDGTTKIGRY